MPWDPVSRLLFPAPASSYGPETFPDKLIYIPKVLELGGSCPAELRVPCLFLHCPSARFLVLYLHSNAEDVGKCHSFCHLVRVQFQVHVLAVEYPGYGLCPGGPATAGSATENAFAAFRFVREVMQWPTDSIFVFGRSIGTGPAVLLAVQYKVAGLILIAPFLSIKELVRDGLGGMLSNLVEERFPSGERIHLVRSPVLIIHGQQDTLIPQRHSALLYERCRGRKQLVCPEQMQHNTNLFADPGFLVVPMLRFFSLPDYSFEEVAMPTWAFRSEPDDCTPILPGLTANEAPHGCGGPAHGTAAAAASSASASFSEEEEELTSSAAAEERSPPARMLLCL